ncbi:MAG: alpha/beta fold hydrolase [Acidimicrobiia bacterium]|nr:alpha/beta fold hydrolase [Acidimicrobiia bacterium]
MTIWTQLLGSEVRYVGTRFRTRALLAGDGEPLLLLHGQGGSLENFRHNIAAFAEHYRVVAVDFLWHGLSEKPPLNGPLIPRLIEQVLDVVDTLRLAPCQVEGQSQGGWVAATLAIQQPELVRKLVLTTPTGLEPELGPVAPAALAAQLANHLEILDDPTDEAVRRRMAILVSDLSVIDDEQFALRSWFMRNPEVNAGMRAAITAYLSPENQALRLGPDELGRLTMPTLLYWGSHNMGGRAKGDALARVIPGGNYHCPDVGHWAQFEQPDEHNRVVLDFLAG